MGRPVGHIVSNLVGYTSLVDDVQSVLDTLVTREVELQTTAGKWYVMRIQPYRTLDNVIEGAVMTFMDITEMKRIEASLAAANRQLRLAVVVRDARDAITVQDLEGRITAWNPGARAAVRLERGRSAADERARPHSAGAAGRSPGPGAPAQPGRGAGALPDPAPDQGGRGLEVSMTATALLDDAGQVYAIATTERPAGAAP